MKIPTVGGAALAIALLAAACGPLIPTPIGSPPNPKGPLMAEFDRNLATWQASGITRYAFTYTPSCFCPLIAHLVVGDASEIRIDGIAMDGSVAPPIGAPVGVDGLFEEVRRAIKGDRATIAYDGSTGVPLSLDSDPFANAVDDEHSFRVTGWTLDPPDDHVLGSIATARRLWDGQNLMTYTWSIEIACDCFHDGRRYDIAVNGNDARVRLHGKPVESVDLGDVPVTVPALFDLVTGWAVMRLKTDATFDRQRGYPTRVEVHASGQEAVQQEIITVVSFAPP